MASYCEISVAEDLLSNVTVRVPIKRIPDSPSDTDVPPIVTADAPGRTVFVCSLPVVAKMVPEVAGNVLWVFGDV